MSYENQLIREATGQGRDFDEAPQENIEPNETSDQQGVCPNCQQWQNWTPRGYYDCFHDCAERGFAPKKPTPAYEK